MKIYLDCECLLLLFCLNNFLKPFLVSKDEADVIVSDRKISSDDKPVFTLGVDLKLPFTQTQLLKALNDFKNENALEIALDELLNNFKKDLIKLLKYAK